MKSYIGVKQIEAESMTRGEYAKRSGRNSILAEKGESELDEGYIVTYSDGYVSWSPKMQFEEAYSEIGINSLYDTVLLMKSVDFKDRFRAEYRQLENRVDGLRTMLEKYKSGTLPFKPKCSYDLLHSQLVHMECYLGVLEYRANVEGINLAYADNPTTDSTLQSAT